MSAVPEVLGGGGSCGQVSQLEARCCWHAGGAGWWVEEKIAQVGVAGWGEMGISAKLSELQAGEYRAHPCLSEHLVAAGGGGSGLETVEQGASGVRQKPRAGAGWVPPLVSTVGDGLGSSLPGCDRCAPEDGAVPLGPHVAPQSQQSTSHSHSP